MRDDVVNLSFVLPPSGMSLSVLRCDSADFVLGQSMRQTPPMRIQTRRRRFSRREMVWVVDSGVEAAGSDEDLPYRDRRAELTSQQRPARDVQTSTNLSSQLDPAGRWVAGPQGLQFR